MAESSVFRKDRHIKYFLRCLKTFLPHHYISNDANRMTLGFFTIAGLDLLDVLDSNTTAEERQGYIDWVYHCQVPSGDNGGGGFRGFTGTNFGTDKRTAENECWDPANVPATFFALMILIILGDDLLKVRREDCLRWLHTMQREDGSFGEVLGSGGKIEGGNDPRFCCCASGIRYILRGGVKDGIPGVEDVNVPKLVSYIEACQNYDGGFGEAPRDESHAGLSYCAIATLSFLGYLPDATSQNPELASPGTPRFERLVRWLVGMQTTEIYEEDEDQEEGNDPATLDKPANDSSPAFRGASQNHTPSLLPDISAPKTEDLQWAGFCGRCNKLADTCYCFWVTGTLDILRRLHLIEPTANRRYLVEKTQHIVGGFGKGVGHPPDIMHAYLGLASLALTGEPDLEDIDPTFCTSKRARRHLESLHWWKNETESS